MFSDNQPSSFKNSPSVSAIATTLTVAEAWSVICNLPEAPEVAPLIISPTTGEPTTASNFNRPLALSKLFTSAVNPDVAPVTVSLV